MEFFLNVFSEFSDKNICHYSKRAQTCHLSQIHASMIYQIPLIQQIQWNFYSI